MSIKQQFEAFLHPQHQNFGVLLTKKVNIMKLRYKNKSKDTLNKVEFCYA